MDYSEKLQEYVEALAEERRKIRVFQRELPLCLQLITQAIEKCKQQLSGGVETTDYFHEECSDDHTSSDAGGPVLEEFIPIKTKIDNDDVDDEDEKSGKKSDWLRSVQLWNQTPDPEDAPKKEEAVVVMEVKKNGGGAFRPFNREKDVSVPKDKSPTAATSSSVGTASGGNKKEEKEGQSSSSRKQRRCWSPELHRRFINALQQLGGAHVATPKQIREFMKVDGLTNDEVKSHLQKYRLHTRRPSSTIHNNGNPQAPQFVVVGGIWVQPPPEYSTMGAPAASSGEATTSNGIYTPVAAPPPPPPPQQQSSTSVTQRQQQQQQQQQHKQSKHTHCHSNSPATSSSTHTTTASPVF